jgi:hypothetical protein
MKRLQLLMMSGLLLLAACSGRETVEGTTGVVIATASGEGVTATLSNSRGYLSEGPNEFTLEFRNSAGKLVDVGAITLYFDMPAMGSMPYMKNDATLTTTRTAGIYRGTVTLEMKGTWQTRLSYQGAAGSGEIGLVINAR